jgi:F0F1-type ATP synthase delta subunit
MNNMTKLALIGASVISMGALTACQSTTANQANDHQRMMKDRHGDPARKMSPEQREQMKEMRAEQRQTLKEIKQACDNKASGTAVQVKAGDKVIDGTCTVKFKADRQALKQEFKQARAEQTSMRGEHRPMRGDMNGPMHMRSAEPLTDAKRAELVKQFDQRLAQRQAQQQAIAQACQGKANGTAVQIKSGERTIAGKCEVRFMPKAPVKAA